MSSTCAASRREGHAGDVLDRADLRAGRGRLRPAGRRRSAGAVQPPTPGRASPGDAGRSRRPRGPRGPATAGRRDRPRAPRRRHRGPGPATAGGRRRTTAAAAKTEVSGAGRGGETRRVSAARRWRTGPETAGVARRRSGGPSIAGVPAGGGPGGQRLRCRRRTRGGGAGPGGCGGGWPRPRPRPARPPPHGRDRGGDRAGPRLLADRGAPAAAEPGAGTTQSRGDVGDAGRRRGAAIAAGASSSGRRST